ARGRRARLLGRRRQSARRRVRARAWFSRAGCAASVRRRDRLLSMARRCSTGVAAGVAIVSAIGIATSTRAVAQDALGEPLLNPLPEPRRSSLSLVLEPVVTLPKSAPTSGTVMDRRLVRH